MPSLSDLYLLRGQIDQDNAASLHDLRRRDHAIGLECRAKDDVGRLMCWLGKLPGNEEAHHLAEASVAAIVRIVALILGFAGMTSFLLASGQGLVNVFLFLLFFVFLQFLFCCIAVWVMFRSVRGSPPVILPVNPARLIISRVFPDRRFLRESQSVIRLLLLRYSQEIGAVFTVGAVLALFIIPLSKDFTYIWESDYQFLNGEWVKVFTDFLAAPWSPVFPDLTISTQAIEASRYQGAAPIRGAAEHTPVDAWRPFLVMSMLVYALFPRLLLWFVSKYFYGRMICSAVLNYPGSERILARMKSPTISTQGEAPEAAYDHSRTVVDWAGALGTARGEQFEEIRGVAPQRIVQAGFGSLAEDTTSAQTISNHKPGKVLVVVRSWEPPMADLRDFIVGLEGVARCTLCLLPLKGRPVSNASVDDWKAFARTLELDIVDVIILDRAQATQA